MWNAIFVLLALLFAGLALWSPLEGWNALFWVIAAGFVVLLVFTASGAIGRHRAREEAAERPSGPPPSS
ncbi:MAG: hypothetical protein R3263_07185 [Myxococcota bacterium]|nr:hypothetical protein [Myxococcota bacterium]